MDPAINNTKLISNLIRKLSEKEKIKLLERIVKEDKKRVPLSIFKSKLSGLEAIVIFLKDIKKFSVKGIARTLKRKESTIYNTYQKAKKKGKLRSFDYSITVPLEVFSRRKFSVLESLVTYLNKKEKLSLSEIATLLNKGKSTIKTVYRRYKIKNAI